MEKPASNAGNSQAPGQPESRRSSLSEEIIETQKARSDLLKWKLLLVAALGAAGLGFTEKVSASPLLLALIPFACVYADLLCTGLKFRLLVIGSYFAVYHEDPYECFVRRVRPIFDLEDWALHWSTAGVSLVVVVVGIALGWSSPVLVFSAGDADVATNEIASRAMGGRAGAGQAGVERPAVAANASGPAAPTNAAAAPAGKAEPSRVRDLEQSSRDRRVRGRHGAIVAIAGVFGLGVAFVARWMSQRRVALLRRQRPPHEVVLHNPEMEGLVRSSYSSVDLGALRQFLIAKGTFSFKALPDGLFPAASAGANYQYVWVRDNVHVAYAHYVSGYHQKCAKAMTGLRKFLEKEERHRFQKVIVERKRPSKAMDRPHIRFDGKTGRELPENWPHAQNDALGGFLWLYCKLARERVLECPDVDFLLDFPRYFSAIRFWEDEDNGHWEETAKVNASSIGAVLAGLRELQLLLAPADGGKIQEMKGLIDALKELGESALNTILPRECISPPSRHRDYDSALLFLIFPLEVVQPDSEVAGQILENVKVHLQGDHGIRRYLGDSYWCAEFDEKYTPEMRAADVSEDMSHRDALLRPGEEAQWCLFDPIVSAIHGQRHRIYSAKGDHERAAAELALQTHHLNRALGQLTEGRSSFWAGRTIPAFACPEAYYLKRGRYEPNDQTPLLWTQASLWLALHAMQQNVSRTEAASTK